MTRKNLGLSSTDANFIKKVSKMTPEEFHKKRTEKAAKHATMLISQGSPDGEVRLSMGLFSPMKPINTDVKKKLDDIL